MSPKLVDNFLNSPGLQKYRFSCAKRTISLCLGIMKQAPCKKFSQRSTLSFVIAEIDHWSRSKVIIWFFGGGVGKDTTPSLNTEKHTQPTSEIRVDRSYRIESIRGYYERFYTCIVILTIVTFLEETDFENRI